MIPITHIKFLGPKSARWLAETGIHSKEDIEEIGVVEVYKALKVNKPKGTSLNALWALYFGMNGIEKWGCLSEKEKDYLLKQLEE